MTLRLPVARLEVDRLHEGQEMILARARGQVIAGINLPALIVGLRSPNHGRRRRAEKTLLRAVKRGVVRAVVR